MRRSYLVTGGAGFIGSHLVEALLARGEMVVAFDNLSTGRLRNLDHLGNHPNLRFVHGSVLDELAVDELMHKCDVVVHLAAAVGVKLIVEEPLRSFTTNIRGSEIVIESAFRHRRPILLTSTSEIYGKNTAVPLKEEDDRVLGTPSVARWAYSTAKAVDEILAYAYHRERGLPTTVVRLFNTVGPRQSPAYGMVVPRLARQAVAGLPLTIYGDGTQTRCFCHVSDVVGALLDLLDDPRAVGGTFNVGSQEEISMLGLAERILARTESTSGIELIPYDQAYPAGFEDMQRRLPSTDKIRALTGWRPTRSLDDILTEAIAEAAAEHAADVAGSP
ncbi:MAG TPA: GDP-mannose 4,6-dehydratase [Acidimicrobiales bacterium]|nr:GDP-mannose 4,6-dehydratase [Acidimicrobiales bacterium]